MPDWMPEFETALHLQRESTAEQVAGALRELIVSARLSAGAHLREGPLAAQLGVSRNTIREAIHILVSQGLVTREIHRGAYVARLTVEDVRDLFRVRRLVELTAVREIAETGDTKPLHDAMLVVTAAIDAGERVAVAVADLGFHRALVDLMHSQRLGELYASVDSEMRLCISRAAPDSPQYSRLSDDHRTILSALESGDADLAAETLERHLAESERLLSAAIDKEPLASGGTGGR